MQCALHPTQMTSPGRADIWEQGAQITPREKSTTLIVHRTKQTSIVVLLVTPSRRAPPPPPTIPPGLDSKVPLAVPMLKEANRIFTSTAYRMKRLSIVVVPAQVLLKNQMLPTQHRSEMASVRTVQSGKVGLKVQAANPMASLVNTTPTV